MRRWEGLGCKVSRLEVLVFTVCLGEGFGIGLGSLGPIRTQRGREGSSLCIGKANVLGEGCRMRAGKAGDCR